MIAPSDPRLLDLFGIDLPVIQAPMAGATTPEMVIAVSEAGGLGSLASATYTPEQLRQALDRVRAGTRRPINLNVFCHIAPQWDQAQQDRWRDQLAAYYREAGLDASAPVSPGPGRAPFDETLCRVVEDYKPEVVSFHFGLPAPDLLSRVRATGARIISSATTIEEALWLEAQGVDAVIAMGSEAGGHRGNFLTDDMSGQIGTFALTRLIAQAVRVPVIAAGGIADARGTEAALALGAGAVQVGTAYLLTPEASTSGLHRRALKTARPDQTAITNLFTGRPARGIVNRLMREIGPMAKDAPPFPLAGSALTPLRAWAEANDSADFTNLWAGQAFGLAREMSSRDVTLMLAGILQTKP